MWLLLAHIAQRKITLVPWCSCLGACWLAHAFLLAMSVCSRLMSRLEQSRANAACDEARRGKGNHRDPVIFEAKKNKRAPR